MTVEWSKVRDGGGVAYRTGSDKVGVCTPQLQVVISLGCFRGVHPLLCKHTPLSVFQRLLHPP